MKSNSNKSYLYGIGVVPECEYQFSKQIMLRPTSLKLDHVELQDVVDTQKDYGFLCSMGSLISFELEVVGKDAKEAVVLTWNNQWLLILISIYCNKSIHYPFGGSNSLSVPDKNLKIYLSNIFISPKIFEKPLMIKKDDLKACSDLWDNFNKLLDNKEFTHAASVFSRSFNEPNTSIRIAIIWSAIEALLNVNHELKFRISLYITHLLGKSNDEKKVLFKKTKALYDGRSKCVHGSGLKNDKEKQVLDGSQNILRDLILFFVKRGKLLDAKELEELALFSDFEKEKD